jgi:hypothetical protein
MTTATAPRHFLNQAPFGAAQAWAQAAIGKHDTRARIAARRTFVHLKQRFMDAVEDMAGARGDWLRYQVRQANEPVDLWLLRSAVFNGLHAGSPDDQRVRTELHRALDVVFPDNAGHASTLPF